MHHFPHATPPRQCAAVRLSRQTPLSRPTPRARLTRSFALALAQVATIIFALLAAPAWALLTLSALTPTGTSGTVGTAYSSTITATGGLVPYTFSLAVPGTLPPGLSLASSAPNAATLSGTPTTAGAYSFTVNAHDFLSANTGSRAYTVTITVNQNISFATLARTSRT